MGVKIKKRILLLIVGIVLVFVVGGVSAAIDLPWSTTYDCDEWTLSDGQPICNGLSIGGGWTCSGAEEQITSDANMAAGNGGRGQRHWEGDGINLNSGGLQVTLIGEETELWIRWYMRYQAGFVWSSITYDKMLYIDVGQSDYVVPEWYGDGFAIFANGGSGYDAKSDTGWSETMGGATSDGLWHCFEVHIKMDTNGADGEGEAWIDGVRIINFTNLDYGTSAGWDNVLIGSNQRTPNNGGCEAVDFDDIAISNTGYIGPLSAICPNGVCDPGEDCSTCSVDCACTSPEICCSGQCITPVCSQNSDCGTNPCKIYTCNNPGTCTASCSSTDITSCINNDGCCPPGCTSANDNDCPEGIVTVEFGNHQGSDYTGTIQDTYINLDDINYASDIQLNTYTWPVNQIANAILIKWDLSALPENAQIQDAKLQLYMSSMEDTGGDNLYDISVHRIINYNPVISSANGYTYDGVNGWTPYLGLYDDVPLAQGDIVSAEDSVNVDKTFEYKEWSVTNMVQDWVSNSGTNYGMLINSDPVASSSSNRYFVSTENVNADQRPKLIVSYSLVESSCSSGADNNPVDGVVSITELMSYISQWKAGSVTITELMTGIGEWKNGC